MTRRICCCSGWLALLLCLAGVAVAAEPEGGEVEALRGELRALRGEVTELRSRLAAESDEAWLNDRRREQVLALVHDVLADAQTRAAMLDAQLQAGYDRGFFVRSGDGAFALKAFALIQTRYIYNHSEQAGDDDVSGFTVRRSELYLTGHAFSPATTYLLAGGFDRSSGDFELVGAFVGHQFTDRLKVRAGAFYVPFMVEQLVNTSLQQAVERSHINTLFSVGTSEGVELAYGSERWRLAGMVHDGTWENHSDFAEDATGVGLAARGELLLGGAWSQFSDFQGWARDKTGARLGGAVNFETAGDAASHDEDVLKYTLDLMVEGAGWNVFVALVGRHFEAPTGEGVDHLGVQVQGGLFLVADKVELFGRYERIDLDGWRTPTAAAAHDEVDIFTLGVNWFLRGHGLKLVFDGVYLPDGLDAGDSGAGLVATDGDQFVFRSAVHMRF